jgi:hypothetical protein
VPTGDELGSGNAAAALVKATSGFPASWGADSRNNRGTNDIDSVGVLSSYRRWLRSRVEANDGGFQVHCVRFNGTKNAQDGGVGGQCHVLASPMRRRPSRRWLSSGPGTLLAFLFHVLDTQLYRSKALASKPSVIHIESFDGTIWRWRAARHCEARGVIAEERGGR